MGPRARILPPYTLRVDDWAHRLRRAGVYLLFMALAIVIGFLTAVLPTSFLIVPLTPILVLFFIVLWMAPDIDPEVDRPLRILFLTTIGASLFWPVYIAYRMPGVGLVSPTRLALYAMTFLFLYAMATSARLRGVLGQALDAAPVIKWSFIAFVVIQFLLALVWLEFNSRWLNVQTYWYLMVLMALIAGSSEGVPRRFGIAVALGGVWCAAFTWWEFVREYKVWMLWVPPAFQGDPEIWNKIVAGFRRSSGGSFRASGLTTTPVTMGELLGVTLPFVLFFGLRVLKGWWRFLLLPAVVLYGAAVYATGSRTGYITMTIAVFGLLGLWALRRYRRGENIRDLLGPTAIMSYPFGAVLGLTIILTWQRAYRAFIGGGHTAPSDNARRAMWERTWEHVLQNPFGYGPNQVARYVGKLKSSTGNVTVDGYYMNMLIDFGVAGFLAWFLLFAAAAWYAGRIYVRAETHDEEIAGPICVSIVCFLVSKGVLSQSDNHHLFFAMVGLVAALAWRQAQRIAITTPGLAQPGRAMVPWLRRRALAARPGLALRG